MMTGRQRVRGWATTLALGAILAGCGAPAAPTTTPRTLPVAPPGATTTPATPPPGLPVAVRTDLPTPLVTGGPYVPGPIPSILPTAPYWPPHAPHPCASMANVPTPGSTADSDHQFLLTSIDVMHPITVAPGDLVAFQLPIVSTLDVAFADPAIFCLDTDVAHPAGQPGVYRAVGAGTSQVSVDAMPTETGDRSPGSTAYAYTYIFLLAVRVRISPERVADHLAPAGVYPAVGAAQDFSWVAGQMMTDPTSSCRYLTGLSFMLNLTGICWNNGSSPPLADRTFVVLLGHPSGSSELGPGVLHSYSSYTVDRWFVNVQPAPDGSPDP